MNKILKTHTNEETGVKTFLRKTGRGFVVNVQDMDSGEFLPTCIISPTYEMGLAKFSNAVGESHT